MSAAKFIPHSSATVQERSAASALAVMMTAVFTIALGCGALLSALPTFLKIQPA